MANSISWKILIFLLITLLTIINQVNSYVLCDDGDSACPDSYICCLKKTGDYNCCSNTRVCCYGGTECCIKEKSLNFLLEVAEIPVISVGAFSIKNTKKEFIDTSKVNNAAFDNLKKNKNVKKEKNENIEKKEKINFLINKNFNSAVNDNNAINISALLKSKNENKKNLDLKTIKSIFEFADGFFQAAKIYENFTNFSNCKLDFILISQNGKEIVELIKEIDLNKIELQKISELLKQFSDLFKYLSNTVITCQNVQKDFLDLENKIKKYLENEELQLKLIGSLIMNEHLIRQKVIEFTEQCRREDFSQCGKIGGELFALVFYVL